MSETHMCRSCGGGGLEIFLSLGQTPLANRLLTVEQLGDAEPTYPLDVAFCPSCTLVQITETVPPEVLFRDYLYFSSFSDTMLAHAREISERMTRAETLDDSSLVVEVASNDGYLLQYYRDSGIPVLGVEPATNIAKVAEEKGIPTVSEFFGSDLAGQLAADGRRADVMHANNVLAHVADLNSFVRGFERLLGEEGVAVIEAPYVKDMIDGCEFDTVYHEHLCYYSLTALVSLFERNGLKIHDVERIAIHGGSLRLFASRSKSSRTVSGAVTALLAEEAAWGVSTMRPYVAFAARVEELKSSLRAMLADLKQQGKRLAAYGASAKGSTLLNYFGIGRETLDFVVDRSTVKQGWHTPGTRLQIRSPEALLEETPDYVLLLTWNFADEILAQQADYLAGGGKFIIPIPELRVV